VFLFYSLQLPIFQDWEWPRKIGLAQLDQRVGDDEKVGYERKFGLLLLGLAMCVFVKVAVYSIRFERALWYAGLRRTDDRLRILLGFKQRKSTLHRSQKVSNLILAMLLMFLSFETVSMVNMIYLILIFLGFIIPHVIYERRDVLNLCLRYTVFMTVLRYFLGITFMVNETWDCSAVVEEDSEYSYVFFVIVVSYFFIISLTNAHTHTHRYGLFGIHINDHNRRILDAVGFHHDTCEVNRTQYVILISALMCLSVYVRVHPSHENTNNNNSTRGLRRHSTFSIPIRDPVSSKRSSVVEVELGAMGNFTSVHIEDEVEDITKPSKEEEEEEKVEKISSSKENDSDSSETRLVVRYVLSAQKIEFTQFLKRTGTKKL